MPGDAAQAQRLYRSGMELYGKKAYEEALSAFDRVSRCRRRDETRRSESIPTTGLPSLSAVSLIVIACDSLCGRNHVFGPLWLESSMCSHTGDLARRPQLEGDGRQGRDDEQDGRRVADVCVRDRVDALQEVWR